MGNSTSSERSPTSSASASETRRPARYSIIISSLALELGADRSSALTSWTSMYSGSFLTASSAACSAFLGYCPRGRRLRVVAGRISVVKRYAVLGKSSKPGVKPSPFIAFAKVKRAFFVYISQSVPTVPVARSVFEIYLKNR